MSVTKMETSTIYTIDEIEQIRQKYKLFQTLSYVLIFIGVVLVFSIFTSMIFFGVSVYLYNESRKLKLIIKIWIIENKVKLPNLTDIEYIQNRDFKNFLRLHVIRRIIRENLRFSKTSIDDIIIFKYKSKDVELIEFKEDKTKKSNSYVCLATKNPDNIEGKTVAWSDKRWNFNLPEKVKTESLVFDKIFKAVSTNQRDARMHLKTNVMQDMIDLNESLASKDTVFYFDESTIYIIFRFIGDALEPNLDKPITEQTSVNDFIMKDIALGLKIFDDFWLSRKTLQSPILEDKNNVKIELDEKMLGKSEPQKQDIKKSLALSVVKIPAIIISLFLILFTLLASYFGSRSLIAYATFPHTQGEITGFKAQNKACQDDPNAKIKIESTTKNGNKKITYETCTFSRIIKYGNDKTYTTLDSTSKNTAGNVGDKVNLIINPSDESDVYVNDFTLWVPVGIMVIFLTTTTFILLYLYKVFGFVNKL